MKEKFLRRMYTLAKIFQIKFLKITILGKISFLYLEQHFDLRFPFRNETYFQSQTSTFHCYHNISMIPLTTARGYKTADDFSDSQVHLLNSSPFFSSILNIFFASCLFSRVYLFSFPMFFPNVSFLVTRSFLAYFSRNLPSVDLWIS